MGIPAKSSLWLSLYAGLTSLFAMLLYQSVEAFVALPPDEKIRRAETIAVVSIGILFVIEPLLSRIKISPPERALSKRYEGFLVRVLSLVVIALVSLCDGLLHEYIGGTISPRGLTGIVQLVSSLLGPSVITFSWLQGLRREPPRAKAYGLYAAMSIGLFSIIVDSYFLIPTPQQLQSHSPPLPKIDWIDAAEIGAQIGLIFLWPVLTSYVASGFLGGLAADRGWCRRAWERIAIGLGVASIVQPVAALFVIDWISRSGPKKIPGLSLWSLWSFIVPAAVGNIGWALGFVLVADSDAIFETLRTKPNESLSLTRESIKVAWAAVLMAVLIVALSVGCLRISGYLTADILNRGSRPTTMHPPSGRTTLGR
jgi:hypothetical protein